jgi:chromosome segregation ATPase
VDVDLSDLDVELADLDVKLADLHLELADLDPQLDAEPGAPKRKERDGESMEARVERLEKLIESLMAGRGKKLDMGSGKEWIPDGKPGDHEIDMAFKWSSDLQGKLEKDLNWERISRPEIEKITRQAQQDAQRAVREAQQQVQRAVRDAQRMVGDSRRASVNANVRNELNVRNAHAAQSRDVQRQMLEAQRHALEMQMNNLERQIERLEEERDRIEERFDEHEELIENLDEEISAVEEREHEHTADQAVGDSDDKRTEESSGEPRPKKAL